MEGFLLQLGHLLGIYLFLFLIGRDAEWPRRILVPTFSFFLLNDVFFFKFLSIALPLACLAFILGTTTTLYWPYNNHLPTLYWPHTNPLLTLYKPLTLYRPHTDPIPTLYQPYSNPILTLYRPYTDQIPTIYQPFIEPIPGALGLLGSGLFSLLIFTHSR